MSFRTILFYIFTLIFASQPLQTNASVTTDTVKNVGAFYAESTSSLIDKTNEKIYGVRDFFAPLVVNTASNLKGIFDGAFIASDTALNSVVSLGRGVLNVGEYQIQNTGESVGKTVALARASLDNVSGLISKKASTAIETTNVAVNNIVKKVATSVNTTKPSYIKVEAESPEVDILHIQNMANAKSAINFEIPDVKELAGNVYTVYANIGNEFLDSVAHSFTLTGESWSEVASVVGNVIANANKNIDEATVALGNAGYTGVKNVLDGGTVVGNGVLRSSEKIITGAGDTVATVLMSTGELFSRPNKALNDSVAPGEGPSAQKKNTSLASIGSIWDFIINKISDSLVPLFTSDSDTISTPVPLNIIGNKNNSQINQNTNTVSDNLRSTNNFVPGTEVIERFVYYTIDNSEEINKLRRELLVLNANTADYLNSRIANQGYRSSEGVSNTINNVIGSGSQDIDANTLSIGNLDGVLVGNDGAVSATSAVSVNLGGTGTATLPTYGQLLLGNSSGLYDLVATSSLGISAGGDFLSLSNWYATTTDALDEGSVNQYWTNTRFDNRLSATTSLPNILTLGGLTSFGTSGATTTTAGNLSIAGSLNFNGSFYQNGSAFVGSQWTTTGSDVYYSTGKVGVGTSTPSALFDIYNGANTNTGLFVEAGAGGNTIAQFSRRNGSSGDIKIAVGSGHPGITFASSLSDKFTLGYNTNGYFSISQGGVIGTNERFTIANTSGNVGVSTTTPWGLFSVNPYGISGPAFVVGSTTSSTATNFIITNGGNVGIGTTTPPSLLTVGSTDTITSSQIEVGTRTHASNYALGISGGRAMLGYSTTAGAVFNAGDAKNMTFYVNGTNNTFQSGTAAMTILGNTGNGSGLVGNVGIGTTTPFAKLAINPVPGDANSFLIGSSTATHFVVTNAGYVGIGTSSPAYQFEITGDFNTSGGTIKTGGTTRITNTGGFSGSVGNAGAPGFSFSIDSNTGMYRPSADNLGLVTAGVERLLIGSAGNIGVASSTPFGLLSLNPDGITGPSFVIGSSTATHFVVTNGGNVGIGTASPTEMLHIVKSDSTNAVRLIVQNSNGGVNTKSEIVLGTRTTLGDTNVGSKIQSIRTNTDSEGTNDLMFAVSTGTTMTERMRILGSGNVGVGSTTPYGLLSVNPNGITGPSFVVGSSTATNFIITNGGRVGIGGVTSPVSSLDLIGGGATGGLHIGTSGTITFSGADYTSYALFGNDTTTALNGPTNIDFRLGNSTKGTFSSAGNFGIGTTTPWGLSSINPNGITGPAFVVGSSTATNFIITNAGNVGIGTSNPTSILHIPGALNAGTSRGITLIGDSNTDGVIGGAGGPIVITAGNSAGADRVGGAVTITAGNAGNSNAVGGAVTITAGTGKGSSLGGALNFKGGLSAAGGSGGSIIFSTAVTTTHAEAMRITSAGNLGIGSTTPFYKLSVEGTSSLGNQAIAGYFTATSTTATSTIAGFLDVTGTGSNATSTFASNLWVKGSLQVGSGSLHINTNSITSTDGALKLSSVGDSNINNKVTLGGQVFMTGLTSTASITGLIGTACLDTGTNEMKSFTGIGSCIISSARFKHDIQDLTSGLDEVNQLRPVTFIYNGDSGQIGSQLGFIAEEMNLIDPRLVVKGSDGLPFSVRYENMTALLAKAIQELDLNLDTIASTTASSTPASNAFATSFFTSIYEHIASWIGDATNGIKNIFADKVTTKELCVGETCVTEAELKQLLLNNGASHTISSNDAPSSNTGTTNTSTTTETTSTTTTTNTETTSVLPDTTTETIGGAVNPPVLDVTPTPETVSPLTPTPTPESAPVETAPASETTTL